MPASLYDNSQWVDQGINRDRRIKFISLFGGRGHLGPYSPYQACNYNQYKGIIIFGHIDNPQGTVYN